VSEFGGDDEELEGDRPWRHERESSGKTLRFTLMACGLCIVLGLATAMLMNFVGRGLVAVGATPVRANAMAPRPAVPPPGNHRVANTLSYVADSSGHFFVDATVNGTPMRFLVDTGATLVALSPDDAAALGLAPRDLRFADAVNTANGVTHAAHTTLRSIRLGQLEVPDVSAVVMEQPMSFPLLGMSFLSRVQGYSIHDGVLTIEW
jgi:aspartyl protease family protein